MSRLDANGMMAPMAGAKSSPDSTRSGRSAKRTAVPACAWSARLLGIALLAVGASAQAATCRVTPGGVASNDGSSWALAKDLPSALASSSCGEIWVAEGVYKPTAGSDRTATFAVSSGVAVYGGFGGTENNRAERDPAVHRSVLSGDIGDDDAVDAQGVTLRAADIIGDNSYHVVSMGAVSTDTVLDGFTLSGGLADDSASAENGAGGGLVCHGDAAGQDCSPTLRQLVFRGNSAGVGGGMACLGQNQGACSATLEAVAFVANTAQFGSGMASAGLFGGHCTPVLRNVTFNGNSNSTTFGAGAFANVTGADGSSSSAVMHNATFSGNIRADGADGGGAIFNWKSNDTAGTTTVLIVNAIAWDNGPNAVVGDPMTFHHSILQDGCPDGSVCSDLITGDPRLGALQNVGGATPVMLPGTDSVALDAGTCTDAPAADQRGVARPQGAACDIGAVEVRQAHLSVHVTGAGDVAAIASPVLLGPAIVDCTQSSGQCSAWYRAEPDALATTLVLHPGAGNSIQSVSGCGGNRSGSLFTTAALEADCTVEVVFAPAVYRVGGTVTGLAGSGLMIDLQNPGNGGTLLIAADGTFAFDTELTSGDQYTVVINEQPSQPAQTCVVVNDTGTISDHDITNVVIHCGAAATWSVGGTLGGLATGASITLSINGSNALTLAANGVFAFAPRFAPGDGYVAAVVAQPAGQHCTLDHAEGTVANANVADIHVSCSAGGAQLALSVTDGGDYARYGQVRDYFVKLDNIGNDSASGIAVGAVFDTAFDAANVQWVCMSGAPGTSCTSQGAGGFADTATLPPGTSLVWIVRVPVRAEGDAASATLLVHAVGASDASDTDTLVIFQDGVDVPYADGAGVVDPALREASEEDGGVAMAEHGAPGAPRFSEHGRHAGAILAGLAPERALAGDPAALLCLLLCIMVGGGAVASRRERP